MPNWRTSGGSHGAGSDRHKEPLVTDTAFMVMRIVLFVPAIVLHEVAHGYVCYLLGAPTAKMAGRLSLNPVKHVDPFGTVILPLMLAIGGGPIFGYAKPVPINPHYYKDYRKGMLLSGLAGPTTNLMLAVVAGLLVRVIQLVGLGALESATTGALTALGWLLLGVYYFAQINLVLLFFNLIPIPPLDGSRVLPVFLSDKALMAYHRVERYGILIFFALLLLLPSILGFSPLSVYFDYTVSPVLAVLTGF
jgi:Zn-dependent protease